ncbi:M30 family zinc metallopeptidase [Spirochaeta dissipatitropha]
MQRYILLFTAVLLVSSCALINPDLRLDIEYDFSGEFFDGYAEITLIPASSIGKIYYTLDGSRVSESSNLYRGPITIHNETNLRARMFYREKRGNEIRRTFLPLPPVTTESGNYSNEKVYLLLVNSGPDSRRGYELIDSSVSSSRSILSPRMQEIPAASDDPDIEQLTTALELSREIAEENRSLLDLLSSISSRSLEPVRYQSFSDWEIGAERNLYIYPSGFQSVKEINTKLREKRSKSIESTEINLFIWVQTDDSVDSDVTEPSDIMVGELADRFLRSGEAAIYDWAVDIAGKPWGSHNYSNLIPPEAAQEIHIVLKDMSNPGFAGYFWAQNNFLNARGSNEGLYFYLNSALYADPGNSENGSWSPEGSNQQIVYSTLAHEFQHMINFYQKAILQGDASETWLDELAAMAMEDLLADKLNIPGPRELELTEDDEFDYGPGSSPGNNGRFSGRLSFYNGRPEYSLTQWGVGRGRYDILFDYALSYSFGAYLLRAYGGPALLREIIQNRYSDDRAITEAVLKIGGTKKSFEDLLLDFSEAALRSGSTSAIESKRLNNGSSGFDFSLTEQGLAYDYRLGSINLYNFNQISVNNSDARLLSDTGPRAIPAHDLDLNYSFAPGSSHILLLGNSLQGSHSFSFRVPYDMSYRIIRLP